VIDANTDRSASRAGRFVSTSTTGNAVGIEATGGSFGIRSTGATAGICVKANSNTAIPLYVGLHSTNSGSNAIFPAIEIGTEVLKNGGSTHFIGNENATGVGRSINFQYGQQGSPQCRGGNSSTFDIARINVVADFKCDTIYSYVDTYQREGLTFPLVHRIYRGRLIMPFYGAGNFTGTPEKSISVTSAGAFIEVPEKWGAISTSTDASGDIIVAHGMGVTPTSVQVTVTGTTPYVVTVHTIDATNFTVRFFDMTGAAVASTAVTATWHCKT
jgi:hypothetical protein